jgi:hypothetical protein
MTILIRLYEQPYSRIFLKTHMRVKRQLDSIREQHIRIIAPNSVKSCRIEWNASATLFKSVEKLHN